MGSYESRQSEIRYQIAVLEMQNINRLLWGSPKAHNYLQDIEECVESLNARLAEMVSSYFAETQE